MGWTSAGRGGFELLAGEVKRGEEGWGGVVWAVVVRSGMDVG